MCAVFVTLNVFLRTKCMMNVILWVCVSIIFFFDNVCAVATFLFLKNNSWKKTQVLLYVNLSFLDCVSYYLYERDVLTRLVN